MPYPELPRHTVDALGIETSYYTAGRPDREAVVLLHGMSTSGDSFRELMHALARDHYLIAPDLPGFGYSENTAPYVIPHLVEWLAAFFEALELHPAHVIGHSFSGLLAPSFALSYPQDVRSLTLLAPAILITESYPDWVLRLSKSGISESVLGIGVNASRVLIQRHVRTPFYDPARMDDSVWERRLGDYERARASAAVLRAVALYDIRPRLAQLSQPTCIIWGSQDSVVNPAGASRLGKMLPNAEVHLLDACGHVPQIEQQAQVAALTGRFLANGYHHLERPPARNGAVA